MLNKSMIYRLKEISLYDREKKSFIRDFDINMETCQTRDNLKCSSPCASDQGDSI